MFEIKPPMYYKVGCLYRLYKLDMGYCFTTT